jgi:hypothetical protein
VPSAYCDSDTLGRCEPCQMRTAPTTSLRKVTSMAKFTAYKCDGCGKIEKAGVKKRKSYGYTYKEDKPPEGWQSLTIPGKRGHICSAACVEAFAKGAVEKALAAATEKFAKAEAKAKKAGAKN